MPELTGHWWSRWNPVQVSTGRSALELLAALAPSAGRVLLVTTAGFSKRGVTARVKSALQHLDVVVYDGVEPNPQLAAIDDATERFAEAKSDVIVALGGGSAVDTAKVLGVTLASGESRPLQRVLRSGVPQDWRSRVPVIAVPTTSGTGAEVTPFATVWDSETHRKYSVAGPNVYPVHAVLDPLLTLTLPADETLHSGLDSVSHALESLWNRNRSAVSTAWALQSLALAVTALPAVLARPDDLAAREDLQHASLLAGFAISQTRTAIAHSISYPMTLRFAMPHGLACSFTLPALMRRNAEALEGIMGDRELFRAVYETLGSLHLPQQALRYASVDQIQQVEAEMQTADRLGNYSGVAAEPRDLLAESLGR